MNETSTLKNLLSEEELAWFTGRGIDIGCGRDPVTPDCRKFDRVDGDAGDIGKYVRDTFDWVYSSHCLEHLAEPETALAGWWKLVRKGGLLIVVVPDEDLYEQGHVRRFNRAHRHTFTISKRKSWSETSINVLDLIKTLPNAEVVKVELQDIGIDRRRLTFASPAACDFTAGNAVAQIMFVLRKTLDDAKPGA